MKIDTSKIKDEKKVLKFKSLRTGDVFVLANGGDDFDHSDNSLIAEGLFIKIENVERLHTHESINSIETTEGYTFNFEDNDEVYRVEGKFVIESVGKK